jgi:hypothetical protein
MDERGAVDLTPPPDPHPWWLGLTVDPDKVNPQPVEPLSIDSLRWIIDEAPPHECTGLCYYLVEPHIRVNPRAGAIYG